MGIELTPGQLVAVLNGLRWCLLVSTSVGCLLCVDGIWTAYQDLRVAHAGNGGRQIATLMRLRVEVLLIVVFVLHLALAAKFTVPIDILAATTALLVPVVKARLVFNASVLLLLMVKVVMRIGRRQLDQYYNAMTASAVLQEQGLYTHKRESDRGAS